MPNDNDKDADDNDDDDDDDDVTPRLAPSSGTLGNNPTIWHFKCHAFAGKSKSSSRVTHAALCVHVSHNRPG
jgi:hypothetical protein